MYSTPKTVLVTGSSRGIGKEIAYQFAANGYQVILNGYNQKNQLNQTAEEFQRLGYAAIGIAADVSDYQQCQYLFQKARETFGQIDILINNAGISHVGLFTDMTPREWSKVIQTNLFSVFHCTHLALPEMIRKKEGIIINISSIWGQRGASCEAVYSASKGGIEAFTKAIAKEMGPSGIRVNAIACGVIDTQMNQWLTEEERSQLQDDISLMRFGKPSEAASLAYFLASPQSSYLTGQVITLDGGMY